MLLNGSLAGGSRRHVAMRKGAVVRIKGLKSKPGLNGTCGTIEAFSRETGRYGVRAPSEATLLALRPESLELLEAQTETPGRQPRVPASQAAEGAGVITLWLVDTALGVPILAEDGTTQLGTVGRGEVVEAYLAAPVLARLEPSEAARLLSGASGGCGRNAASDDDEEDEACVIARFRLQHAQRCRHWTQHRHWDQKAFIRTVSPAVVPFGGRLGGPAGPIWFVRSQIARGFAGVVPPPPDPPAAPSPSMPPLEHLSTADAQTAAVVTDTAERPLRALEHTLTDDVLSRLRENGYVVVDQALPRDVCARLRAEMERLDAQGQLRDSRTYDGGGENEGGVAHEHIREAPLEEQGVRALAPTFALVATDPSLLERARRVRGLEGLASQQVRLQVNAGHGGCYTMQCARLRARNRHWQAPMPCPLCLPFLTRCESRLPHASAPAEPCRVPLPAPILVCASGAGNSCASTAPTSTAASVPRRGVPYA